LLRKTNDIYNTKYKNVVVVQNILKLEAMDKTLTTYLQGLRSIQH